MQNMPTHSTTGGYPPSLPVACFFLLEEFVGMWKCHTFRLLQPVVENVLLRWDRRSALAKVAMSKSKFNNL